MKVVLKPPASGSLPELLKTMFLDVTLGPSRLMVLGDFHIHARATQDKTAQDLLVSIAAMGLS